MNNSDLLENAEIIKKYFIDFSPEKIGIFGSFSRNQQNKNSDIDILIKFKNNLSLFKLAELEDGLSELLGVKVDLITDNSIKNKRIREQIEKEVIYI